MLPLPEIPLYHHVYVTHQCPIRDRHDIFVRSTTALDAQEFELPMPWREEQTH